MTQPIVSLSDPFCLHYGHCDGITNRKHDRNRRRGCQADGASLFSDVAQIVAKAYTSKSSDSRGLAASRYRIIGSVRPQKTILVRGSGWVVLKMTELNTDDNARVDTLIT